MSVPQGSVSYNAEVGDRVVLSLNFATTCSQVQDIANQAITSLNGTLAAVTSQLSVVETSASNLAADIAAITGWQTAQTSLSGVLGGAAAIPPIPSAIVAYLQVQATAMITVNDASILQIIKQLLQLNADYNAFTGAISTLTAQLTAIPNTILAIENAAIAAASRFPDCVLP